MGNQICGGLSSDWLVGMTGNLVADALVVVLVHFVGRAWFDGRVANSVPLQVAVHDDTGGSRAWLVELINASTEPVKDVGAFVARPHGVWQGAAFTAFWGR